MKAGDGNTDCRNQLFEGETGGGKKNQICTRSGNALNMLLHPFKHTHTNTPKEPTTIISLQKIDSYREYANSKI